jgi:hypothetical protein
MSPFVVLSCLVLAVFVSVFAVYCVMSGHPRFLILNKVWVCYVVFFDSDCMCLGRASDAGKAYVAFVWSA